MNNTNKGGRPSAMTEETLRKLETAFSYGLSDREACLQAGIGTTTLYNYCHENPGFRERKELLKLQPTIKAKYIVAEALDNGDLKTALWYLERKARDEFSTRIESELSGSGSVIIVDDLGTE